MTDWQDRFRTLAEEAAVVRRHLHAHPELAFEEFETAKFVAEKLAASGYEVRTGIGGTGVVGTLRAGGGSRTLGLRADMDALPIEEATGLPYASRTPGKMHACGHDGHTAMLLGAAAHLAATRNFDGTVHLIFQPAEEGKAGARRMMDDGLFEAFPCDAVYGLHNWPDLPVGRFNYRPGPMMASNDRITVRVLGKGAHGSAPHTGCDPIVAAASIVVMLQSVVGRNVDPLDAAVVSVTAVNAGSAFNIIPQSAEMKLSIRTLDPAVRTAVNARVRELIAAQAQALGCRAEIVAAPGPYPVLVNDAEATEAARDAARALFGADAVFELARPVLGSEDFAFMLEEQRGAYFLLGSGAPGAPAAALHNPAYDFNDAALLPGIAFWAGLVETLLAPSK
ncbi:Hippurate hydrolase [uncultured Alphaproteobacteria bacterium]|uniref:Hippurate hydrolase n=1 Tax=uncultured Alphaproteobacteria bacterium TaxID=91750 RepID=A0A212J108_9PROT|nr:Hippurate hydrolase [uncultured Alphaproteobacteria bacterium]